MIDLLLISAAILFVALVLYKLACDGFDLLYDFLGVAISIVYWIVVVLVIIEAWISG